MRSSAGGTAFAEESLSKGTPLALLWAFTTLVWSLFTPPHRTFAARVLLLQPLWGVRMYLGDATWVQDLVLCLTLHAIYSFVVGAWHLINREDIAWIDFHDHVQLLYYKTFALLGGCGMLAGAIVFRGSQLKSDEREETLYEDRIDDQLLPPLLISSRTTHSRLFPERHSFSYSYLLVGIPVGIHGRISNAISVESRHRSWFHIDSSDYLARGGSHLGLGERLKRYLHSQGVTDRDYSFAYLVTAPRFLGYSFNPVSFWYLYDSDIRLKYLILEVNNTFDERRIYLLNAHDEKIESIVDPAVRLVECPEESAKKVRFTDVWEKDFHVSPFNSRRGSYSIRATDPLAAFQETGQVHIDNTIVLRSSKEHAKIVARVWSEGAPKEATEVTPVDLTRFIAAWWWVGLATFPRIVWEAQKLFFRRKLHVWYRPEVTSTSIGRAYTDDERQLETYFSSWLAHVVEHASQPLRVIYEPAHHDGEEIVLYSPDFTYEEDRQRTVTLTVLSPAFYSRIVHYAHVKEAFDRECLATEEENRTIAIDNAPLLPILLDAIREETTSQPEHRNAFAEQIRWSCLRLLRCPPPTASYHGDYDSQSHIITDIRSFSASEIDRFVQTHAGDTGAGYRRLVTKLFLAQRLAGGFSVLVAVMDWIMRASFLLAAIYYCFSSDTVAGIDVLRRQWLKAGAAVGQHEVMSSVIVTVLANLVHLWSLGKG